MFHAVPSMGLRRYKSMELSGDLFWRFGGFFGVILFQKEDMILFLRVFIGSDR